jgi:hypothetical protein
MNVIIITTNVLAQNIRQSGSISCMDVFGHPAARRKPQLNKASYRGRMRRLARLPRFEY